MANVTLVSVDKETPPITIGPHTKLLLAIEFNKEQAISILTGWYSGWPNIFYVDNEWIQDDLDHGYARVIGWAKLDDLDIEARKLQSL